jgi:hypothetical protein
MCSIKYTRCDEKNARETIGQRYHFSSPVGIKQSAKKKGTEEVCNSETVEDKSKKEVWTGKDTKERK